VAKLTKEKHSAEVAAAELRGKAEAERDTQRMEVQMAQQQLDAARAQVARLEGDIKDYKARAQVSWRCIWYHALRHVCMAPYTEYVEDMHALLVLSQHLQQWVVCSRFCDRAHCMGRAVNKEHVTAHQ
jgi:hypothetical protein